MSNLRTVWSMVGKWLIYVPDPEGGEQQLCLPEHMKAEAHLLGAAADLASELEHIKNWLRSVPLESGYCCCGSPIDAHGMGDGHSPVDELAYSASQQIASIETALTKAGRTPCSETVG